MATVTSFQAKTRFNKLLDRVRYGAEVVIMARKTVAVWRRKAARPRSSPGVRLAKERLAGRQSPRTRRLRAPTTLCRYRPCFGVACSGLHDLAPYRLPCRS